METPKSSSGLEIPKRLDQTKNLKALRLNLQNCVFTEDSRFFYRFLGILGENTNLETLDLTFHLINIEEDEQNEGAKRLLSQIQSLGIQPDQLPWTNYGFNQIQRHQKKMRLLFFPNNRSQDINISKIVAKCSNLKTLILGAHFEKLKFSPDLHLSSKLEILRVNITYKNDQKTLELLHFLSNNSDYSQILNFSIKLHHLTDDILKELTKINSSFSPNRIQQCSLYTRDIKDCNQDSNQAVSPPPRTDLLCQFLETISRLTSLGILKISTCIEEIDPIKSLENSLGNLTNLTELELQIYAQHGRSKEILFIDMSIYKLSKLRDFRLKISNNFRFKDFMCFLDALSQLQELQGLTIDSVVIDSKNEEGLRRIAKALDKFPKCKRMYVNLQDGDDSNPIQFIDAESNSRGKKPWTEN